MNFEKLLNELSNGNTFEGIAIKWYKDECDEPCMVECIENEVYEDQDLYDFLTSIGAEIEDFGVGYAVISTEQGKYYEIPYELRENRFGDDLPNETILFFDRNRIYDVTENYMYIEE